MPLTEEDRREADWLRRLLAERIKARVGEIAIAVGAPSVSPSAAQAIARIAVEELVAIVEEVGDEEEAAAEGA